MVSHRPCPTGACGIPLAGDRIEASRCVTAAEPVTKSYASGGRVLSLVARLARVRVARPWLRGCGSDDEGGEWRRDGGRARGRGEAPTTEGAGAARPRRRPQPRRAPSQEG